MSFVNFPGRTESSVENFRQEENSHEDTLDDKVPENAGIVAGLYRNMLGEAIYQSTLREVQQEYIILNLKRELESKENELFTASKRIKELEGMLLSKPSKSD